MNRAVRLALGLVVTALTLTAHIGTSEAYLDANAGPYRLLITVEPPPAIPGIAQLQVRAESPAVREIRAAPLMMTGPGAKYTPIPDLLTRSPDDAQFFTGSVWLMSSGSAQIRFTVRGDRGDGTLSLPLPAIAQRTKSMEFGLAIVLFALMSFLVLGLVAIAGAAVREAPLEPGAAPDPGRVKLARFTMAGVFVFLLGVIWIGARWWDASARDYSRQIYKPLQMNASAANGSLRLTVSDPGWFVWRKTDDFIPDHGHLMHLYALREPKLDAVYHLHPVWKDAGLFEMQLPALVPGQYRLYADVVHQNGFPETMTASVEIPPGQKQTLEGDDAGGSVPPIGDAKDKSFPLPDGYRMVWSHGNESWKAGRPELFRFTLLDAHGSPASDMALYMGMPGHAAFLRDDGSVFAHIHPNGSVAMAALMMTSGMHGMMHPSSALSSQVSFPFGFPKPGRYRIIVQMKHGSTVETGVFDAQVS